jgi:adenosylcobinamide-GDP ribazoletransferase
VLAALGLSALLPSSVVAALVVTFGVLLTGGLHLDGLMDSCDGLFCVRSPEQRLAIMRDSHTGAFGVLGAVCLLLIKYTAVSALLAGEQWLFIAGLLLAPVLSRWAMAIATVGFPYGRPGQSLGSSFHEGAGRFQLAAASAIALLLVLLICMMLQFSVWIGLAALVGTVLFTVFLARLALVRLPGLTGDVYGAINEVIEVTVLMAFTFRWPG